jgi:hypothetical protein
MHLKVSIHLESFNATEKCFSAIWKVLIHLESFNTFEKF